MRQYSIVDIGKELQKYGLRVGEHPEFGKVGTHAPGSYHYSGKAIDVTDWRPDIAPAFEGGKPIHWKQRKGELSYRAKKSGLFTEALGPGDPGHSTHVHLALKDNVTATPELLQWIATGRYKNPEGTLSDVMPVVGASQPSQKPQQHLSETGGPTYIFLTKKPKEETDRFLQGFSLDRGLMSQAPEIKSMINPTALLTAAFNQGQSTDFMS